MRTQHCHFNCSGRRIAPPTPTASDSKAQQSRRQKQQPLLHLRPGPVTKALEVPISEPDSTLTREDLTFWCDRWIQIFEGLRGFFLDS
jgi:hypothetical protein